MIIRAILFVLGFIVLGSNLVGCLEISNNFSGEEKEMTVKTIAEVLKEHTEELMSISGVVGIGQGLCNDKPCIKVLVIEKTPELSQEIPDNLQGYKVMVEETGEINALPDNRH
jgi:hypothetical protein